TGLLYRPSIPNRVGNKNLLTPRIVINVVRNAPTVLTKACSNCITVIASTTASPKFTIEGSEPEQHTNLNARPSRKPTTNIIPNAPTIPKSIYSSATYPKLIDVPSLE